MVYIEKALTTILILLRLVTSLGLSIESVEINGFNEEVYTVVADPGYVQLEQRLSFGEIYGFEKLEDMSKQGEIAVNGMFYNDIGRPSGILIINGELIKKQSIGQPLFIVRKSGLMELVNPELTTFIELNGHRFETYELNEGLTKGQLGVFTPYYGAHDRRSYAHRALIVEDHKLVSIIDSDTIVAIPKEFKGLNKGDFMVDYQELAYDFPVKLGDEMSFLVESNFDYETVDEAFQTGGWLVREGVNVANEYNYIGNTDSLQPRTAIGIREDNRMIIKVVDGRNSGVSEGVTGRMLADLLIADGCISAAYLDGGASSTLVKNKEVMNQPSLKESKRIPHGLFFYRYLQDMN